MASKLVVIAILGLAGAAACIGAAIAIGGGNLGELYIGSSDGRPRCERDSAATATSRDIDWDGSDKVQLAVYSNARYAPGSDTRLHASGDPQVLSHLRILNGKIDLDCYGWRDRDQITLTLPGRAFRKFAIAGRSDLTLERLNQDSAQVEIAGTGSITASGRIDDLVVKVAGTGHADLGKVTARDARVELAGIGSADIAPSQSATIKIAGPSTVNLYSNPKILDTEIAGPGRLRKIAPGG